MRFSLLSLLLFAAMGLSEPTRALQAECYPSVKDVPLAANWPVCVIYLHGLHPPSDKGQYEQYEPENRPLLRDFSDNSLLRKHCRIAAPVAPAKDSCTRGKHGRMHCRGVYLDWQGETLANVEQAAQKACGGAKLKKGRTLVGFSAGGWDAFSLGSQDCKDLAKEYTSIRAIGLAELGKLGNAKRKQRLAEACPITKVSIIHDFPGQFTRAVQQSIADSLPDTPPDEMAGSLPSGAGH